MLAGFWDRHKPNPSLELSAQTNHQKVQAARTPEGVGSEQMKRERKTTHLTQTHD